MYIHQLHFCVLFRLYIDRCTQGIWMNLECEVVVKTSHKKVSDRQRPSGIIYMCLKLKGVPQKSTGHDENKGGNHDKPLDWMGGVLNFSVMHLSFYRFFLLPNLAHVFCVLFFFWHRPGQLVIVLFDVHHTMWRGWQGVQVISSAGGCWLAATGAVELPEETHGGHLWSYFGGQNWSHWVI